MAIDYTHIFTDLGLAVRTVNVLKTAADNVDAESLLAVAQLDDDADDAQSLVSLLAANEGAAAALGGRSYGSESGQVGRQVSWVRRYMTEILAGKIDSTGQSVSDILDDLIAAMTADSETVDASGVTATVDATTNRAGTGTIVDGDGSAGQADASQMAIDDDLTVACVSAATAGSEVWQITSRRRGRISGTSGRPVTGVAFPGSYDDLAGVEFTITAPTAAIANDGSSQLSSWAVTGGAKSTNCDADGIVYVELEGKAAALSETGDGTADVSGYDGLTGLACGTNTDADGKIYLKILDADADGTADRIDLYADSGLASQVGHTADYDGTGDVAVTADNSSGLGGTLTIDSLADDGSDDGTADVTVAFPFVRVSVYSDSGTTALVAQSAWELDGTNGPNPSDVALVAQNSSGLSGTVDVAYTADDTDIEVTLAIPFAVGDEFKIATVSDEAGTFQSFFAEYFDATLPSDATGSETINDSLAE